MKTIEEMSVAELLPIEKGSQGDVLAYMARRELNERGAGLMPLSQVDNPLASDSTTEILHYIPSMNERGQIINKREVKERPGIIIFQRIRGKYGPEISDRALN